MNFSSRRRTFVIKWKSFVQKNLSSLNEKKTPRVKVESSSKRPRECYILTFVCLQTRHKEIKRELIWHRLASKWVWSNREKVLSFQVLNCKCLNIQKLLHCITDMTKSFPIYFNFLSLPMLCNLPSSSTEAKQEILYHPIMCLELSTPKSLIIYLRIQ